jgi:membrane protease YdiL (CAAX protease family)
MDANSYEAILRRRRAGALSSRGPALMLFARSAWAVVAQGFVAAAYALGGSQTPWRDAAPWLPVYGTLIDAGCLALMWRFTRDEGIGLLDLVGFERGRLARDVLIAAVLIPPSLVFILGGVAVSGVIVYGAAAPPYLYEPLPWAGALYGLLVWPIIWGLTEQMTYNGYLLPRLQVLCGRTSLAVALVSFAWSFQHAFMPLTFDEKFMLFRLLGPLPFSVFITLMYLRVRRLLPFALAHAIMDGASVLIGVVLPLLKT